MIEFPQYTHMNKPIKLSRKQITEGLKQTPIDQILVGVHNADKINLTKKQKEVIRMTFIEGKTQNEISSELGKHQTTVHKILQGNIDRRVFQQ